MLRLFNDMPNLNHKKDLKKIGYNFAEGLPCGITKYNKKANLKQIPQSKALAVASCTIKI
ncbi:hypothetical protein [Campylobacter sp. P0085]|uniref:hypothetical protein n=1 Tax=Campylobacter sp. P0085 TaxID=1895597 RepID=UPI000A34BB7D|nr:hypothetical protein [Campylobacter sp. P0085]